MDSLDIFLIGLILMGLVLNIIDWRDYYRHRVPRGRQGQYPGRRSPSMRRVMQTRCFHVHHSCRP
jgi:hypothetical protein